MAKKALVIGAGPAGLTAAYELITKGEDIEVVVFEESECFGGISKKALGQSAMSAMMKNADLQGGARAIINANVEYDVVSYLGIYTKVTATATGTIIEFTK